MAQVTFVQEQNDHLFKIFWDNTLLAYCDKLDAEEFQCSLEDQKHTVRWVYLEDLARGNNNA